MIVNAAREPEIADLGHCLIAMGAKISGLGSSELTVEGVTALHGASIAVMPDRIEAGTYAIAAAIAGGEVELVGARRDTIAALLELLASSRRRGRATRRAAWQLHMNGGRPHAVDVTTAPYPGFPTDLQAQFMALMTVAERHLGDPGNDFREPLHACAGTGAPGRGDAQSMAIPPSCAAWKSSRARR